MRRVLCCLVACSILGAAYFQAATAAEDQPKYTLDLPRLPLGTALDALSKRMGFQVSVQTRRQVVANPLKGHFTVEAALNHLLAGSGVTFEWVNEKTVLIVDAPPDAAAEKPDSATTTKVGPPASSPSQDVEQLANAATTSSSRSTPSPLSREAMEVIEVTGSRIGGTGIGPAPLRSFSAGRIERFGVTTLPDMTRYFPQQPFAHGENSQQSGAQYVQIRGLGFDSTLVLINGRRTVPSANSLSVNAFDLNTIPVTAIDRVEVLSDSASAVYGADAIAGVVNVILKQDPGPPKVSLHYGTAEGGATERRASLSGAYTSDRFRGSVLLDYLDRAELFGSARSLSANQDFRRFGGQDFRVTTANPGNVFSLNGQPLPGLSSSRAAIPDDGSNVASFLETAGSTNWESPIRLRTIMPSTQRHSAIAFAEFDVLSDVTAFADLFYAGSTTDTQVGPPTLNRTIVPATNAFNPFDQAVAVDYLFTGVTPINIETTSDLLRATAGARGTLSSWEWEVGLLRSEEDSLVVRAGDLDSSRVAVALASPDPAAALNVFRAGTAGSDELLASLLAAPTESSSLFEATQLSGFLRGPILDLPGGAAELVVGGEWRQEHVRNDSTSFVDKQRDVAAAFTELKVPLVNTGMEVPGIYELSLSAAARIDNYEKFGDSFNPQYGLIWRPMQDLRLRASFGTSFRPPSLFEQFLPSTETIGPVRDPRRGNAISNVRVIFGGNPDLKALAARSLTAGFVYTPHQLRDLRISSSYWRVVVNDRITFPPSTLLIDREEEFADRIVRADPTAADIAAGYPGALQSIDVTRMNFGRVDTSGIDFDISYLFQTSLGCFNPTLSATWVNKYSVVDVPSSLPTDRVGVANLQGTIPEWRVVGTFAWKREGWGGASSSITYAPSYQDATQSGPINRSIESQTIVDVQGWLELGEIFAGSPLFGDVKLTLGVLNLFDQEPPFAQAGLSAGYDTSQASLKQRFGYLRLSKSF